MIVNYTEPQLNIDQILSVDTPTFPRQSAVIVGAQYVSPGFQSQFDYQSFDDEGDTLNLTFSENGVERTVDSEGLIYKLDPTSLDVLVKDAEFDLFTDFDDSIVGIEAEAGDLPTHVIVGPNLRVAGNADLWSSLHGRPISVGDIAYCYNQDENFQKRKVVGFIGKQLPSTHGTGINPMSGQANADTLYSPIATNPSQTTLPEGFGALTTSITVPAKYSNGDSGPSFTQSVVRTAVNLNGLSYAQGGVIYSGVKLTLRITSYSNGAGSASLNSSDGIISTSVPFTFGEGAVNFDLSGSISQHGISSFESFLINGNNIPSVGEVFTFTVTTLYTPLDMAADITDAASSFTGTKDNTFFIKVITGSFDGGTAVLRVYDSRGSFTPFDVNVPDNESNVTIDMPNGMQCEINNSNVMSSPQIGFRKNDVYFINAVASKKSTTEFTGLILDGPAVNSGTVIGVKIRGVANGSITTNQASGNGFELNENGTSVNYYGGLTWFVPTRNEGYKYVPLLHNIGEIYANWRAVAVPPVSEGVIQINNSTDLAALGSLNPSNDLAYAARIAYNRITGTSFYVLRTSGESESDIAAALEKIENTDLTYALAVISSDNEAFFTAIQHAEEMSAKNVKNFRRVYYGAKCPNEFVAIDTDENGDPITAILSAWEDGTYRYVTFTYDVNLVQNKIVPGDFVDFNGARLVVERVVSNIEILCTAASALEYPIPSAAEVIIVKPNSAFNQAEFIKRIAKRASSRRGSLIWCDSPISFDGAGIPFELHPKFIAAEVAALRSVLLPQSGLSRQIIQSVSEAPSMYAKYKRDILNDVAANGVMIISQESEGSNVIIRHQLTTDSNNGILYYEDSVGVNLDNLSFKIKDALNKYVGTKNITPKTLGVIHHELFTILDSARSTLLSDLDIGPQIINFTDVNGESGKITVQPHPTFRDRIQVKVKVSIPLPMNVIEVEIEAISDVVVSA